MKKLTSLVSILMAMILCVGLLSACSDSTTDESLSSDNGSDITSDTDDGANDSSSDDSQLSNDVIGKVTSIDSSYIVIDAYEADSEITDYTMLDGITLTDALTTDTITLETDAVFEYVSSGVLYSTTLDGVAVGDMIAVTTDEDGLQQIVILEYDEDDADASDDSSTDDTTSDDSTDSSEDDADTES